MGSDGADWISLAFTVVRTVESADFEFEQSLRSYSMLELDAHYTILGKTTEDSW